MPVSTTNAISGPLLTNGLTTTFPFTFTAPSADEVQVISRNIATGVDTIVSPSLYSVTLTTGGGGSVVFSVAPASGAELYLLLNPDFTQDVEFYDGAKIAAASLNRASDRGAARDQFLRHETERALKVEIGAEPPVLGDTAEGQALVRRGGKLTGESVTALAEELAGASVAAVAAQLADDLAASEAARDLSQAWAEGTLPGGAGTKSAKEHAQDAEGFADDAAAGAALAQTIIEAAVLPQNRYQTRAAANAAVGGLPNGAAVLIYTDESYSQRPTMNEVVGGAVVWRATLYPSPATIYWDGRDGSDTNNGLTAATPVKTWAAAIAKAQPGDTILGRGGFVNHGVFSVGTKADLTIGAYGTDGPLILDGSRPVPAEAWVQDPDSAVRFYVDIVHETAPAAPDNGFCVYEDRLDRPSRPLFPKWTAGSIAANRAFLNANRDHFTSHKVGSTNPDPRSDSPGTTHRYYVCPPDGLDPRTGEIRYFVNEFQQVLTLFDRCRAKNVIVQRSGAKDLGGHNQNKIFSLEDCEFNEGFTHGWVGGALIVRRVKAHGRKAGGDYSNAGGGGIHIFEDGATQRALIEDCYVEDYGNNYYSHSGGWETADHEVVIARNLVSRRAQGMAFAVGQNTTRGVHINGFDSFEDAGGFQIPVGSTVRNFRVHLKNPGTAAITVTGAPGGTVECENGTFIITGTPTAANGAAGNLAVRQSPGPSPDYGPINLVLKNVTKVGGTFSAANNLRNINYIATDCILGDIETLVGGAVNPFASLVASNTQLQWGRRSLAEIQAIAAGVASNCIVPWVAQPYSKVLTSGQLSYVGSGMFASTPDAGNLARVEFNQVIGLGVGDTIKIVSFDGTNDHVCRMVSEISANNWTVSPALPSAIVGSKDVQFAHFNRKICPASTGLTAVFSDDGMQAYFSSADDIAEGMTVWFGGIGRRRPFGARKIVALAGRTATLDRKVDWNRHPSASIEYSAFGATNRNTRPAVPVAFGFPIRPVEGSGDWGATFRNVLAAPASGTLNFKESTISNWGGRFNFVMRIDYMSHVLADGTVVANGIGQIKHLAGEIDAGLTPVGVGDTITVTPVVFVEDYAPQFATDPALSGLAALRPGTVLADLGLGARAL